MAALSKILHWLVASSWIHERVQALSGTGQVDDCLAAQLDPVVLPGSSILDVGGGTGLARKLFPRGCSYICLDSDELKLRRFSKRHPNDTALLSDAARMPVESDSIDFVLCKFVSHHVADERLPALFSETARILKGAGRFVFVDAVWSPERRLARLLWKYDRGSYPRTEANIKESIATSFDILTWEQLAVFHRYVVCVAALKGKGPVVGSAGAPSSAPA